MDTGLSEMAKPGTSVAGLLTGVLELDDPGRRLVFGVDCGEGVTWGVDPLRD